MIIIDEEKTEALLMARLAEKAETNRLKKLLKEEQQKVDAARQDVALARKEMLEGIAFVIVLVCFAICIVLAGYKNPFWVTLSPLLVALLAMKKVGWV